MKFVKLAMPALLMVSCGVPTTPGDGNCAAHLSGGISLDLGCYVNTLAETQNGNGYVDIEFSQPGLASNVVIETRGVVAPGVFNSNDPAASGICEVVTSSEDNHAFYTASAGAGSAGLGGYKLALTSVTPRALYPDGGLESPWLNVHGTLDCQMGGPPNGSFASASIGVVPHSFPPRGVATLHVTF
jgi:hypothetical protein